MLDIENNKGNTLNQKKNIYTIAIGNSLWVLSLRIIQQILNFGRYIILGNILSPHDFGLMGIATLTMASLETFSETGFQSALIQKKDNIKEYLNTAWTISIIRGFILYIILSLIAPSVALFFNVPEAKNIIQIIGLSVICKAFINIGIIYFQKNLEFNKQFIYSFSGTLVDFIISVISLIVYRSVWALVFGLLAGNFTLLIASYLIHPFRPSLQIDLGKTKELFSYGKWVTGSIILVFIITQGDDILVGKLLSVTMLGYYQMAYRISNSPATEITHVISQVTFPIYSKIQEDIPKLKEYYLSILEATNLITYLISGLILILAYDFTDIFLGQKWIPIVKPIQVLAIAGQIRSMQATIGPVFYAIGKTKIDTKLQIIRLIVLAIFIYPLTMRWGITGASCAVLISISVATVFFVHKISKILGFSIKNFINRLTIPTASISITALVLVALKGLIEKEVIGFLIIAIFGIMIYFFTSYLLIKLFNPKLGKLIDDNSKFMTKKYIKELKFALWKRGYA